MNNLKASDLKYLAVFAAPVGGFAAIYLNGIYSYLIPFTNFFLIPILDILLPESKLNLTAEEEEDRKNHKLFDWLLYISVLIQFSLLFYFLYVITTRDVALWEIIGKVWSFGIVTAVLAINAAHELGHRTKKYEQFMAKALLLTSLYMHFYIDHNRGHHKNVGTPLDTSTAFRGQSVFRYYLRSVLGAYFSAWRIANNDLRQKNKAIFSLRNEMVQYTIVQFLFCGIIYYLFGWLGLVCFVISSLIGAMVMETINYIEHYGLSRNEISDGKYEKILPIHSWNSDHILGRIMLLELTRHSDHHYKANRKYQILRRFEYSPQLPLGYPGSMVLAWIPPLWFYIMHKKLDEAEKIFKKLPENHPIQDYIYHQIKR